jgi:predicted DNA-binding WGR domain protein
MPEVTYIHNGDAHNKFWSYDVKGNSVHVKWGRIGGSSDEQLKEFGSAAMRHSRDEQKGQRRTAAPPHTLYSYRTFQQYCGSVEHSAFMCSPLAVLLIICGYDK